MEYQNRNGMSVEYALQFVVFAHMKLNQSPFGYTLKGSKVHFRNIDSRIVFLKGVEAAENLALRKLWEELGV